MSKFSLLNKNPNPADADTSSGKIWTLAILGVLSSLSLGYFLKSFFDTDGFSRLVSMLLIALAFILIFLFQAIFIKSKNIILWIIAAESLTLVSFFIKEGSALLISAWLAALILLYSAANQGRKTLNNQLKIKFTEISKKVIPGAITALAVFASIIYVGSINSGHQIISQSQLKKFLTPAEPIIKNMVVKDFSLNMTVGQIIESLALSKLDPVQKTIISKSPAAKKMLINQALESLKPQAEKIGLELNSSKTIIETLSDFINQKFAQLPTKTKTLVFIGLGFLIFLTIKTTAALIHWLIYFIAYIIYEILIVSGFIRISLQSQSKEIFLL